MNKEIEDTVGGLKKFAVDSQRFLQVCEKPDVSEFKKIATSCAIGFAIMGGIGYVVKLLFIPINNIILSWSYKLYFFNFLFQLAGGINFSVGFLVYETLYITFNM